MFITDKNLSITYNEFTRLVIARCQYLTKHNICAGDTVAVYIDGSIQSIINICAVLINKSIYVPIDETIPLSRKQIIFELSNPKIMLDSSFKLDIKHNKYDNIDFNSLLIQLLDDSTDLAYIIFTSGTTGVPKGVKITRGNLLNYILYINKMLPISLNDSTIITTSISFDLAYTALYVALYNQSSIRLLSHNEMSDISQLTQIIRSTQISFMKTTPTILAMLLKQHNIESLLRNLKFIILGGEQIKHKHVKKIIELNPKIKIVNHYGPCETTIGCCAKIITSNNIIDYEYELPIGKAIANAQLYIVDDKLRPVPFGQSGRLLILGPGVGAGYINPPDCNGFIMWNNKPAFLTEDIAKYNKYKEIVILGRTNDFIKIRGYRISTYEIEQHILKYFCVEECQVKMESKGDINQLVCYYISSDAIDYPFFRHTLESIIPLYMIPQRIYRIDSFSKSANGKLQLDLESHYNKIYPIERKILRRLYKIWIEIGGDYSIKPEESFFEYNIDSLMNLEFIIRLEKAFPYVVIERENILRTYYSLELLEQAIKERTVDVSSITKNIVESHISYNNFDINRWNLYWLSESTSKAINPLPLTQRYYILSGIMDDVVLNDIIYIKMPIWTVIEKIKSWISVDDILKGYFNRKDNTLLIKECNTYSKLPIPMYPLSSFHKSMIEKIYSDFIKCKNLIFFPCCFGDSDETYIVIFMRHLFCKTNNISYFKLFLHDGYKLDKNIISSLDNKTINTSEQIKTYAKQYSKALEIIQNKFNNKRKELYVSQFVEMSTSDLKRIDGSLVRIILWLVLKTFNELFHIVRIPIRLWRNNNRLENMTTSLLDQSNFEFYLFDYSDLVNLTYMDYLSNFDKLAKTTYLHNMLHSDVIIYKNDININIVDRKNENINPQIAPLKAHLKSLKANSVYGICIYGEIDMNNNSLNICYSSNYNIENDAYFAKVFKRHYNKLISNEQ